MSESSGPGGLVVRKERDLQARDGFEIKLPPNTSSVIGFKCKDLSEPITFLM